MGCPLLLVAFPDDPPIGVIDRVLVGAVVGLGEGIVAVHHQTQKTGDPGGGHRVVQFDPQGRTGVLRVGQEGGERQQQIDAEAPARRKTLAAIYGGTAFQHRTLNEPKYRQHIDKIVYLLDRPRVDLSQFDAVLIPDRMHPDRLLLSKQQFADYQQKKDEAEKLLTVGSFKNDPKLDRAELAAWTVVANTVLNLDETITKN